jgi:uncharacterized SAM-binding protein YcdF (DUF218 family)
LSPRRRSRYGLLLAAIFIFLIVLLNYNDLLLAAGEYLVECHPPEKAAAIVVLAGDWRGGRIMRAVELVRAGYAPKILVSGPTSLYGFNEADLAIRYAIERGAPPEIFEPVYVQASSTLEEAEKWAPELSNRDIRKVLLVTSNFHTRRASSIFSARLAPEITVQTVCSPDPYFRPDSWWHNREGQKTVFYEYSKTVANWLGM